MLKTTISGFKRAATKQPQGNSMLKKPQLMYISNAMSLWVEYEYYAGQQVQLRSNLDMLLSLKQEAAQTRSKNLMVKRFSKSYNLLLKVFYPRINHIKKVKNNIG